MPSQSATPNRNVYTTALRVKYSFSKPWTQKTMEPKKSPKNHGTSSTVFLKILEKLTKNTPTFFGAIVPEKPWNQKTMEPKKSLKNHGTRDREVYSNSVLTSYFGRTLQRRRKPGTSSNRDEKASVQKHRREHASICCFKFTDWWCCINSLPQTVPSAVE